MVVLVGVRNSIFLIFLLFLLIFLVEGVLMVGMDDRRIKPYHLSLAVGAHQFSMRWG